MFCPSFVYFVSAALIIGFPALVGLIFLPLHWCFGIARPLLCRLEKFFCQLDFEFEFPQHSKLNSHNSIFIQKCLSRKVR